MPLKPLDHPALPSPPMKTVWAVLLDLSIAIAYFFAARIGLSLAVVNASTTAVWPPTGLSIAAVTFLGTRAIPGIFLGAFVANYVTQMSLLTSLHIAAGNTLEAVLTVWLMRRFASGKRAFDRPQDVFRYALCAMAGTVVSATIGSTALALGGHAPWAAYGPVWFTWWMGDTVSALKFAPLIIIWVLQGGGGWRAGHWAELGFLLLTEAAFAQFLYGGWSPLARENLPVEYLVIPFLIWACFRLGRRGATLSVFLISILVLNGTLKGFGPFALPGRPNDSLLLAQAFVGVMCLMSLVIAALVAERDRDLASARAAAGRLAEANRELEQFAYVASHDLQEPLRKIINYDERLLMKLKGLGAEESDYLRRMHQAALRMKTLIEDLLQYSRMSHDARGPYETVTASGIVRDVLSDLDLVVERTAATVEVTEDCPFEASRSQLTHAFQNLITNSIKFARPGVPCRVEIRCRRTPGSVTIEFADNGIGFDEKYSDRIFRPFQRLHSSDEYEGTGIGLSIVQRIAGFHGGSVRAQSRPGQGATFTITLPQPIPEPGLRLANQDF